MDGTRFDVVAKAVANGGASRRSLVRGLAGGALGLTIGGAVRTAQAQDSCARGVMGRKRNCCHREGDRCRTTHQCCNGRCEEISGRTECGACFSIGAPCVEGPDCCTFICARGASGKICANA
ncbi:MAG: hypothetical protein M3509_01295 [Chloroflexota bacterium]|nr:hypothetical protein [Chloroflexota bacterium]